MVMLKFATRTLPFSERFELEYEENERGERSVVHSVGCFLSIDVRLHNTTQRDIEIFWLDYSGNWKFFKKLKAQVSSTVTSFGSHPFVFRDTKTHERMVVNDKTVFRAEDALDRVPKGETVPCDIALPMQTLRHKASVAIACRLYRFTDADLLPLPPAIIADLKKFAEKLPSRASLEDQPINEVNESGERVLVHSERCTDQVFVQFHNATQRHVDIYWLDYDGKWKYYNRLKPLHRVQIDTYATHPWIFRDAQTKERIFVNDREIFRAERMERRGPQNARHNWILTLPMQKLETAAIYGIARRLRNPNDAYKLDLPTPLADRLRSIVENIKPSLRAIQME